MEDLRNTVDEINNSILMTEAWDHIEYRPFLEFIGSPIMDRVEFCGFCIWDSESDERIYLEDKDEYEPFKSFLLREIGNLLISINAVHNILNKVCK